jgi:hypothetical protein
MFNNEGQVVELAPLLTHDGGDFDDTLAFYLAVDFEVANQYALWAQKRDPNQVAVVVRIAFPNAALEALGAEDKLLVHWPSDEWKEAVWTFRRRKRPPGHFARYRRASLVIGTICGKPSDLIANLNASTDITHDMVLRNARGEDAAQYAFVEDQGQLFLEEHGMGNCTVHPMTPREAAEIEVEMARPADNQVYSEDLGRWQFHIAWQTLGQSS